MRISASSTFTDDVIVASTSDVQHEDEASFALLSVVLEPDTKYYWQLRRSGGNPTSEGWDNCSYFTATFTTAKKEAELLEPSALTNDYYETDFEGALRWRGVSGADQYRVALSSTAADCDAALNDVVPASDPTFFSGDPLVYLGDTLDYNSPRRLAFRPVPGDLPGEIVLPEEIKLFPDFDFDPEQTYHLYLRPERDESQGACAHYLVRKRQLLPFEVVSPVDHESLTFDARGPFRFTASAGASSYQLSIGVPAGSAFEVDGAGRTLHTLSIDPSCSGDCADGSHLSFNDGVYAYTLPAPDAKGVTTSPGELMWWVTASHPSGDWREADEPGCAPHQNCARFYAAAKRLGIAPLNFAPHGPAKIEGSGVLAYDDWGDTSDDYPMAVSVRDPGYEGQDLHFCLPIEKLRLHRNTQFVELWYGDETSFTAGNAELLEIPHPDAGTNDVYYCSRSYPVSSPGESRNLRLIPYSQRNADGELVGAAEPSNVVVRWIGPDQELPGEDEDPPPSDPEAETPPEKDCGEPLTATRFLGPAGIDNFFTAVNVPNSPCTFESREDGGQTVTCDSTLYYEGVSSGLIPTVRRGTVQVQWYTVTDAKEYVVTVGNPISNLYAASRQGVTSYPPLEPLSNGLMSISVAAVDECGDLGRWTNPGLVNVE